jgi:hypothetical protein
MILYSISSGYILIKKNYNDITDSVTSELCKNEDILET